MFRNCNLEVLVLLKGLSAFKKANSREVGVIDGIVARPMVPKGGAGGHALDA